MAMLPPGVLGKRRMMPALISGNVMPRRTDCGSINKLAERNFSALPKNGLPTAGNTDA